MAETKNVTVEGRKLRCLGYYCYNGHYNTTIFEVSPENETSYLGEIQDCQVSDSDFRSRITKFLKNK